MAAHGLIDLPRGGLGGEFFECGVERDEAEHVAVRAVAPRRARTPPAAPAEVVASFQRPTLDLAEPACVGLDPPREPTRERAARRVGILHHQRERACFGRRRDPLERRRYILALARVTLRDRRAVLECRTAQREHGHERGCIGASTSFASEPSTVPTTHSPTLARRLLSH